MLALLSGDVCRNAFLFRSISVLSIKQTDMGIMARKGSEKAEVAAVKQLVVSSVMPRPRPWRTRL